jgi:hypothetical protein
MSILYLFLKIFKSGEPGFTLLTPEILKTGAGRAKKPGRE